MLTDENKNEENKDLEKNLNKFLKDNSRDCDGEECQIKDPEEIVKRENKKIITNDGRQLLSEYTG